VSGSNRRRQPGPVGAELVGGALQVAPAEHGAAVRQRVGEGERRRGPLQRIHDAEAAQQRRAVGQRHHGGPEVLQISRTGQVEAAQRAAGLIRPLVHLHLQTAPGQHHGAGQAVRTGPDDVGIDHGRWRGAVRRAR
jgi:hypothetical protein